VKRRSLVGGERLSRHLPCFAPWAAHDVHSGERQQTLEPRLWRAANGVTRWLPNGDRVCFTYAPPRSHIDALSTFSDQVQLRLAPRTPTFQLEGRLVRFVQRRLALCADDSVICLSSPSVAGARSSCLYRDSSSTAPGRVYPKHYFRSRRGSFLSPECEALHIRLPPHTVPSAYRKGTLISRSVAFRF
jgi:hypothetical protein